MSELKLSDYKKNKVLKLDGVTTGVYIERRHKVFVESNGINLSSLMRDVIDSLMADEIKNKMQSKK